VINLVCAKRSREHCFFTKVHFYLKDYTIFDTPWIMKSFMANFNAYLIESQLNNLAKCKHMIQGFIYAVLYPRFKM